MLKDEAPSLQEYKTWKKEEKAKEEKQVIKNSKK
jgi:hypothetical protein